MKLLKDERINLDEAGIKLTMRPVTTSQQARIVELASANGISARMELTSYCLKNCIEQISIDDVKYEPLQLANSANISDDETLSVMIKLGEMVTSAAFAKDTDTKK